MLARGLLQLLLARQPVWVEREAKPIWQQIHLIRKTPWRSAMLGTGWAQWARRFTGLLLAGSSAWALWQHAAHGVRGLC
jgi:hypothetical protein